MNGRGRSLRSSMSALTLVRADAATVVVLGLVLTALVLHTVDLGLRALHHDESLHATFSWYLVDGRGYRHDPLMHGPFQFHVIAAFFKLFGDGDTMARLPAALFGTALVATPLLFRRWLGVVGVVATALFLVVSPSLLYYSRFARNDIFIAVWTVLLFAGVWRYREDGRFRWLLLIAAVLALSFATKETTYLTAALLLVAISVMQMQSLLRAHEATRGVALSRWRRLALGALLAPLAWLVAAAWPLLGGWRARMGWSERPREVDLMVVLGTLTASQLGAAVQIPIWALGGTVSGDFEQVLGAATVTTLILGGAAVGLGWRWRWWLACAGVFSAIFVLLYSTFFTNLDGIGSGLWESLDYWLDQQDVRRGNQPGYYYFMMVPLYELLTLVPALLGAVWLLWRRDGFALLLLWWFLGTFVALSMAGEKMPWLTVHMALPLTFLAGYVLGRLVPALRVALWERRGPILGWAGAGIGAAAFVLVLGLTVRNGLAVSFSHPDTPVEPLIYTQTSPELPPLARRIEEVALADPANPRQVYVDTTSSITWPWAWYLRHLSVIYAPRDTFREGEVPEGAILVVALDTMVPTDPLLFEYEKPIRYHHRWWFQEAGYRQTSPEFLWSGLRDGSLAADWWHFLLNRLPESTIGSLDGEVLFPEGS
jgi:predicted membrane-bound mannosyltransferase